MTHLILLYNKLIYDIYVLYTQPKNYYYIIKKKKKNNKIFFRGFCINIKIINMLRRSRGHRAIKIWF